MTPRKFEWFLQTMEREGISSVVAFMLSGKLSFVREHLDSVVPYAIGPAHGAMQNSRTLQRLPELYRRRLRQESAWKGIGEFALYRSRTPGGSVIKPDHPALMKTYAIAGEFDVPVMVHPPYDRQIGYSGPREESPIIKALERAFQKHRETTFLIHGVRPDSWIHDLFSDHSNWYYDPSPQMNAHAWEFMFKSDDPIDTVEEYTAHMSDEEHFQEHVDEAVNRWGEVFREHPRRVMLGWDLGVPWHFNQESIAIMVRLYREILGHLSTRTAERIAHGNAEQVIKGARS